MSLRNPWEAGVEGGWGKRRENGAHMRMSAHTLSLWQEIFCPYSPCGLWLLVMGTGHVRAYRQPLYTSDWMRGMRCSFLRVSVFCQSQMFFSGFKMGQGPVLHVQPVSCCTTTNWAHTLTVCLQHWALDWLSYTIIIHAMVSEDRPLHLLASCVKYQIIQFPDWVGSASDLSGLSTDHWKTSVQCCLSFIFWSAVRLKGEQFCL